MQLVIKSSSPSCSSSSQSAGGRPDHSSAGMEKFQRLHLLSSPPPSPPSPGPPRKATNKHRRGHHGGSHSPPPHHRGHLDVRRLRHESFPPPPLVGALHCKADKLRLKNPKHCKKAGNIHRKLIKTCKHHKGTAHDLLHMHNICPGAPHYPGCCLHSPNPNSSMMQDDMWAELEQHPPCHHEAHFGHHGRHGHPHRHGRHYPHDVRSVIRCRSAPPMSLARHEAKDMQAKPAKEAGMLPPVSDNMLLAVEEGPAEM